MNLIQSILVLIAVLDLVQDICARQDQVFVIPQNGPKSTKGRTVASREGDDDSDEPQRQNINIHIHIEFPVDRSLENLPDEKVKELREEIRPPMIRSRPSQVLIVNQKRPVQNPAVRRPVRPQGAVPVRVIRLPSKPTNKPPAKKNKAIILTPDQLRQLGVNSQRQFHFGSEGSFQLGPLSIAGGLDTGSDAYHQNQRPVANGNSGYNGYNAGNTPAWNNPQVTRGQPVNRNPSNGIGIQAGAQGQGQFFANYQQTPNNNRANPQNSGYGQQNYPPNNRGVGVQGQLNVNGKYLQNNSPSNPQQKAQNGNLYGSVGANYPQQRGQGQLSRPRQQTERSSLQNRSIGGAVGGKYQ